MDNTSLYLKYRPHDFGNLVGQDHIKDTLMMALKADKVSHAYLFTGPRGTGKTSTARLVAKALNCSGLKDGYEPCDVCDFCKEINTGSLIDILEIDAASNRGIDEVRDLKEKINFAPTSSKYKVYIIDEVHMMTREAFNALLKTLEEPPEHAYFILATTEVHKIPETILSRCQRFDFRKMTHDVLVNRLNFIAEKEKIKIEKAALEMISRYVDGGMRDAIGLLEQLSVDGALDLAEVRAILGVSETSLLDNLFKSLVEKNVEVGLKIIEELNVQGSDFRRFCHDFIELLRQQMLNMVISNNDATVGLSTLLEWIEIFQAAQEKVKGSIPQLALEIAVIKASGISKSEFQMAPEIKVKKDLVNDVKPQKKIVVKLEKPVKKVEPIPEKKVPTKETPKPSGDLMENWQNLIKMIKTPSLRMSLKNANPRQIKDGILFVEFGTNFHKSKVDDSNSVQEIQQYIVQIFGSDLKIETSLNERDFKPAKSPKNIEKTTPTPAPEPDIELKKDIVDDALDIFGGELMD